MTSAAEALRQCYEAMKLVDFKDCAESAELWHKFNLAQANAERVLRDGEKQEPYAYAYECVQPGTDGKGWSQFINRDPVEPKHGVRNIIPLYTHPAPSLPAVGAVPEELLKNPQLLRIVQRMDEANRADDFGKRAREAYKELCEWIASYTAPQPAAAPSGDAALKFADHIINGMFEGGDWDGGDVQELAVKYGLLKPETMQGPCSEDGACQCAQNGAEFPSTCYRKTYATKG